MNKFTYLMVFFIYYVMELSRVGILFCEFETPTKKKIRIAYVLPKVGSRGQKMRTIS